MSLHWLLYKFAQATYGEGAYGSGAYGADSSSDALANTGTPIVIAGTIGVALLLAGVILFIQSRKRKK